MNKGSAAGLITNIRFYILATSLLLAVAVFSYVRLVVPSDQLYVIRVEQVFGLLAVIYWYIALIISPIGGIVGKERIKRLAFARRAIGVSAALFAVLHGVVAVWGQLGGLNELALSPPLFQYSIAAGSFGVVVLLVMATTSFDRVVAFMTFRRWKLLHRLTYVAWVAVAFHIWTIGTHLAYSPVQWAAFVALVLLLGLELYRITKSLNARYLHLEKLEAITLFISCWVIFSIAVALVPVVVQNYHSQHAEHSAGQEGSHDE